MGEDLGEHHFYTGYTFIVCDPVLKALPLRNPMILDFREKKHIKKIFFCNFQELFLMGESSF